MPAAKSERWPWPGIDCWGRFDSLPWSRVHVLSRGPSLGESLPSKSNDSDQKFRLSIGLPLLGAAAVGWYASVFLLEATSMMQMKPSGQALPLATMADTFGSLNFGVISSFLVAWVIGMIAMMFPAMVPVMSMYSGLFPMHERRPRLNVLAGPLFFLAGYLLLYALLGLFLYGVVYASFQLASGVPWLGSLSLIGTVAVILGAGVWQLTPLKEKSLAKCISPMGFFLGHSREGLSGALRMGATHGVYCVGCCWLYMLVMLAVAAMSLFSMIVLSGLILVEKVFVGTAPWFRFLSAGVFFSLAVVVVSYPSILTLN